MPPRNIDKNKSIDTKNKKKTKTKLIGRKTAREGGKKCRRAKRPYRGRVRIREEKGGK